MDLVLRGPEHDRKRRDVGDVAETGQLLQRLLGFVRQAGELPDHEVHDVVGVALGANAIDIPGPARRHHDRKLSSPSSASAEMN